MKTTANAIDVNDSFVDVTETRTEMLFTSITWKLDTITKIKSKNKVIGTSTIIHRHFSSFDYVSIYSLDLPQVNKDCERPKQEIYHTLQP